MRSRQGRQPSGGYALGFDVGGIAPAWLTGARGFWFANTISLMLAGAGACAVPAPRQSCACRRFHVRLTRRATFLQHVGRVIRRPHERAGDDFPETEQQRLVAPRGKCVGAT